MGLKIIHFIHFLRNRFKPVTCCRCFLLPTCQHRLWKHKKDVGTSCCLELALKLSLMLIQNSSKVNTKSLDFTAPWCLYNAILLDCKVGCLKWAWVAIIKRGFISVVSNPFRTKQWEICQRAVNRFVATQHYFDIMYFWQVSSNKGLLFWRGNAVFRKSVFVNRKPAASAA